jgi:transcriptional regulator with GAF, ATPase, and Fis domain
MPLRTICLLDRKMAAACSSASRPAPNWCAGSKSSAPVTLEQAESTAARSYILQTLQETKGVIGGRNGAAARLGLPWTTLMCKMQRLGINRGRSSVRRN